MKIGITLAILSLSGNISVFITSFINKVNDLMMAGSIIFNSFEETQSQREMESTAGYLFTPCVGSFTSPGIDTR